MDLTITHLSEIQRYTPQEYFFGDPKPIRLGRASDSHVDWLLYEEGGQWKLRRRGSAGPREIGKMLESGQRAALVSVYDTDDEIASITVFSASPAEIADEDLPAALNEWRNFTLAALN